METGMDLTFALGVLGILQICFLPGVLISHFLQVPRGIPFISSAFGLSLFFNYMAVVLLTVLHCYRPDVVYALIILESLMLLRVYKPWVSTVWRIPWVSGFKIIPLPETWPKIDYFREWRHVLYGVTVFTAFGALFYVVYLWGHSLGTIFQEWDAVLTWNGWAIDWFNCEFPSLTWHYPQLMPTNWSMSYMILMRSDLQLFIKAMMPLFSLFSLLLLLDSGQKERDAAFYVAMPILVWLMLICAEKFMFEYADIPAMYFTLLSVYWLFQVKYADCQAQVMKNVALAALFCAAAALTKQSGLYMAFLFPVFAYWVALKETSLMNPREKARLVGVAMLWIVLLVGSWYLYKEVQIYSRLDKNEYVGIRYALQRSPLAATLIRTFHAVPIPLMVTFILLFLNGLRDKLGCRLFVLIILPYTAIWSCFYAYDPRLLSPTLPFLAINAGLGFRRAFLEKIYFPFSGLQINNLKSIKINGLYCLTGFMIAILLVSHFYWTTPVLKAKNEDGLRQAGLPAVNEMLYYVQRKFGLKGKIYTSYVPLSVVPGLQNYGKYFYCNFKKGSLMREIEQDTSIKYVYVFGCSERDWFFQQVKKGNFRLLTPRSCERNPLMCLAEVRRN
jgi:hypothetical protein